MWANTLYCIQQLSYITNFFCLVNELKSLEADTLHLTGKRLSY